ncbi:MAG: hypothetical protein H0U53_10055 [Actinobacteria bacterium]|nr:hypothetical protein [Actinomycetota bacterium]
MLSKRRMILSVVSVPVVSLMLAACTQESTPSRSAPAPATTSSEESPSPLDAPSPLEAPSTTLPQGADPVSLDPNEFTTKVDNPYFPLEPGTRWTYAEADGKGNKLKVVVVVTTKTKEIANGITARVVRDTVTQDGAIVEDTFDWYAQDSEGNVWYLGENTAEFENGEISSREGSFEAGVDGALPGIIMPAEPEPGLKYRQEYYKGQAEDNGEVLSVDEMVDVAYGHFEDLVLEKNTITIEPRVLEYKLYAKDIGMILALGISGGGGREELVKIDQAPASAGTGPLGNPNP